MTPDVLYEDNHLLALNKPAGMPSAHSDGAATTADQWAKTYLKAKYGKPGNVFVGVVHRLDKPTTGVLLFARTTKAAARLSEQFREGRAEKVYWAAVGGGPWPDAGTLDDVLIHDDAAERVRVARPGEPGGKPSRLHFAVLKRLGELTWVEVRPSTGRKHQIRVQFASRGGPVAGDAKYGSAVRFPGIALHARMLTVAHPTKGGPLTLTAAPPPAWRRLGVIGG